MIITIPKDEALALIWAAGDRAIYKSICLPTNPKKVDRQRSAFALTYEGLLGEWAIAKTLDLGINLDIYLGGDGGRDFTYQGYTIDVKTTRAKYLLFQSLDHFQADVAILVKLMDYYTLDIQGVISRKKFQETHEMMTFGYAYNCAVPPEKLLPIEDFRKYARRYPKYGHPKA